jgi:hypothetical protein
VSFDGDASDVLPLTFGTFSQFISSKYRNEKEKKVVEGIVSFFMNELLSNKNGNIDKSLTKMIINRSLQSDLPSDVSCITCTTISTAIVEMANSVRY